MSFLPSFSYPYGFPETPYLPWVWDAVFDPINREISVYAMSPQVCSFNKTYWLELVDMFPMFKHQLADGLESNINIPHDAKNIYSHQIKKRLDEPDLRGRLLCEFYSINTDGNRNQTYTVNAGVFLNHPFSFSSTNIVCPLDSFYKGDQSFMQIDNHLRLRFQRIISTQNQELKKIHRRNNQNYKEYITVPIKVHVSENHKWPITKPHAPGKIVLEPLSLPSITYKHDLSVCTANDRVDREMLVEWIEYHLLVGVSHFYVYDTSIRKLSKRVSKSLKDVLSDYISEGIVTVVEWHYDNCAKKFASGRQFVHMHPSHDKGRSGQPNGFQPPRPVAQYAALASCYGRFRRNSKYMAHIDEDEFLVVPTNVKPFANNQNSQQKYFTNQGIAGPSKEYIGPDQADESKRLATNKYTSVVEYADSIFRLDKYRDYSAISFNPVEFSPCHVASLMEGEFEMDHPNNLNSALHTLSKNVTSKNVLTLENGQMYYNYNYLFKKYRQQQAMRNNDKSLISRSTPRMSSWITYENGPRWEGKLLMRTEAVRSFFIHYVLQKEVTWSSKEVYFTQPYEAALSHYRPPGFLSGSLYTGKFLTPSWSSLYRDKFVHTVHYQQLNSNVRNHKLNYKHDNYSYVHGNYNGIFCIWPLVCDRRSFPHYCNHSQKHHFSNVKSRAERELLQENKMNVESDKKYIDKYPNNGQPTEKEIEERMKFIKLKETRIDVSGILEYVEYNFRMRMMNTVVSSAAAVGRLNNPKYKFRHSKKQDNYKNG